MAFPHRWCLDWESSSCACYLCCCPKGTLAGTNKHTQVKKITQHCSFLNQQFKLIISIIFNWNIRVLNSFTMSYRTCRPHSPGAECKTTGCPMSTTYGVPRCYDKFPNSLEKTAVSDPSAACRSGQMTKYCSFCTQFIRRMCSHHVNISDFRMIRLFLITCLVKGLISFIRTFVILCFLLTAVI